MFFFWKEQLSLGPARNKAMLLVQLWKQNIPQLALLQKRHFEFVNEDYTMKLDALIVINVDNQACIAIEKDPVHHGHAKHFDVHVHFVWHRIELEEIALQYCPTSLMVADILTKPLP